MVEYDVCGNQLKIEVESWDARPRWRKRDSFGIGITDIILRLYPHV